jgi:hypothetical protein
MKAKSFRFALALVLAWSQAAFADTAEIIEGAKKERFLVVYTSMTVDQMQQILNAFKAKYPFIQPTMFRAVGERLLTKILTETQSGRANSMSCNRRRLRPTFSRKTTCWQSTRRLKPKTFS